MLIDRFRWWNGIGWRHKRSRLAASILTTSVPPPRWVVPPVSVSESVQGASGVIFYCDGQVWYWRGRAVERCHTIIYGRQKNINNGLVQAVTYCLICTSPLHVTMRTVYYDRDCALFLLEPGTICNPKLPMNDQKCIKQNLYKATTVIHSPSRQSTWESLALCMG